MIEVVIKSVSPFAEYEDIVYSYKVICVLSSGREISFIDEKPFDLTEAINKKIKIELVAFFLSERKDCFYSFAGTIEYSDLSNEYYFVGDEIRVLIPRETIEMSNVKINERKEYCFEEFILQNLITETQ